jgi:hypothetical protein
MSPRNNHKAGDRRLADMSMVEQTTEWRPEFESLTEWSQRFPISDLARYLLRLHCDERNRLVRFEVIEEQLVTGQWRRIAVYDMCHHKGLHRHLYGRYEVEFDERWLLVVQSHSDADAAQHYAIEHVTKHWEEHRMRSQRGR